MVQEINMVRKWLVMQGPFKGNQQPVIELPSVSALSLVRPGWYTPENTF
ncbi:uncharacterized protein METZ01_LOCUS514602 [marine metagenome]|uniref:Uncharacterized protein n=1 Tax=marine metagenome TaxID=408172 RepID=A0A383F035_9ZZZZ